MASCNLSCETCEHRKQSLKLKAFGSWKSFENPVVRTCGDDLLELVERDLLDTHVLLLVTDLFDRD